MFDQAARSLWLEEQLWRKLRDEFPQLHTLPEQVLITVGYPASGARGRSDKIKPAEVNYQWQGNANEKAFISIHPVYFASPGETAKAILFSAAKTTGGARWGALRVGVRKDNDGKLHATPETQSKIDRILADIGDPPAGFGVPFPVRSVQRARLRKYIAKSPLCTRTNLDGSFFKHPVIRVASDDLQVDCQDCGAQYRLA